MDYEQKYKDIKGTRIYRFRDNITVPMIKHGHLLYLMTCMRQHASFTNLDEAYNKDDYKKSIEYASFSGTLADSFIRLARVVDTAISKCPRTKYSANVTYYYPLAYIEQAFLNHATILNRQSRVITLDELTNPRVLIQFNALTKAGIDSIMASLSGNSLAYDSLMCFLLEEYTGDNVSLTTLKHKVDHESKGLKLEKSKYPSLSAAINGNLEKLNTKGQEALFYLGIVTFLQNYEINLAVSSSYYSSLTYDLSRPYQKLISPYLLYISEKAKQYELLIKESDIEFMKNLGMTLDEPATPDVVKMLGGLII